MTIPDVVFFVSPPEYPAQSGPIGDYLGVASFARETGLTAQTVPFCAAEASVLFDRSRLLLWSGTDEAIDLLKVRAFVWFPVSFEPDHLVFRASTPGPFAGYEYRQWRVVTSFVEQKLPRIAPCVNDPTAARLASNKLIQLEQAAALGLPVLDTLITSHLDHVLRGREGVPSVIKNASEGDGLAFLVNGTTTAVADRMAGPALVQPFVEAEREIRIYVLGDVIIAVESPFGRPKSEVGNVRNRPEIYKLCEDLSWLYPGLRSWLDKLGLRYAAVDCLEGAGKLSILEVNPNGTWHWLPAPIAEAVGAAFKQLVARSARSG